MAKRKIKKIPRAGNNKERATCTTTWENDRSASIKAPMCIPGLLSGGTNSKEPAWRHKRHKRHGSDP